jgi:glyoxylase-like metal-dependent hydrolase (beta-lactamase superfamily II)
MRSNVYFVRSGRSWALIDAGSAKCGPAIQKAAESLFGEDLPPASILLTHDHPDHAGSARELARIWQCPVLVHADELPLVLGNVLAFHDYANPLDRWLILPLLRLMGSRRTESMVSQASLRDVVRPLDPGAGLPGLPDWEAVPTPGHTPGHVAFFRRSDRVLVSGDALVSVNLNSAWGLVLGNGSVSGPPWYTTWSWRVAKESVASLAKLEPLVLGGGHGAPMAGPEVARQVRVLAGRMA